MRGGTAVDAVRRLGPHDHAAWDAFVDVAGTIEQTTWWNDGWAATGGTIDVIGWWRDGALRGGLLVLSRKVPGLPVSTALSLRGPVLGDVPMPAGVVRGLTDELVALGAERGWVDLRVVSSGSDELIRALTAAMRNRTLRAYTFPGPTDAVVPLAGRSFDDVVAGFHKSTRRDIRAGGRRGGSVRALVHGDELRQAWATLGASAKRQGFGGVRPWSTVSDLLVDRVRRGDLAVIGLCLDDQVVASVVVALVGREGHNIYSGFDDRASGLFPGHRLQATAMAVCLDRGLEGYNLGLISQQTTPTPLDQHKLRFGAEVVRRADRLTWERRGTLSRALSSPVPRRLVRRNRELLARALSRATG